VAGKVQLKKADGTVVPVQGALVEVYRTDIKSSFPSDRSDKKGFFSFAGLPIVSTLVLSVSAPGAKPGYLPNVHPGRDSEKLLITLEEGDGRRWTEDEIRGAINQGSAASTGGGQPSAEEKKAAEDRARQLAEYEAKKKEVEGKNVTIQKALEEGNAAFNAKQYDVAIAKYTEGINADPDFVGSAPVLLNNRGLIHKLRAVDTFNKSIKLAEPEKSAGMAKTKEDLERALDSYQKSWTVIKNAPAADIQSPATLEKTKYDALFGLTETYRLLVVTKSDPSKGADAKEAFDAYLAIESDPVKKAKAQLAYGDIMREVGDSDKAIAAYRVVLQNSPDNLDAMAGLGLSLFNSGVIASDKAQMQEGLNFMQKFADAAPDTHPLKSSVREAVDYLKNTEKLAPQKVSSPKKKT
jgi:tetratricopeptide (TPR) repeat protein